MVHESKLLAWPSVIWIERYLALVKSIEYHRKTDGENFAGLAITYSSQTYCNGGVQNIVIVIVSSAVGQKKTQRGEHKKKQANPAFPVCEYGDTHAPDLFDLRLCGTIQRPVGLGGGVVIKAFFWRSFFVNPSANNWKISLLKFCPPT